MSEVEQALINLQSTSDRATDADTAVRNYRTSFDATQARFNTGLASLFDLEDARRTLFTSQTARVALQRERADAWVALYRAMGGGWSRPESLASAARRPATVRHEKNEAFHPPRRAGRRAGAGRRRPSGCCARQAGRPRRRKKPEAAARPSLTVTVRMAETSELSVTLAANSNVAGLAGGQHRLRIRRGLKAGRGAGQCRRRGEERPGAGHLLPARSVQADMAQAKASLAEARATAADATGTAARARTLQATGRPEPATDQPVPDGRANGQGTRRGGRGECSPPSRCAGATPRCWHRTTA